MIVIAVLTAVAAQIGDAASTAITIIEQVLLNAVDCIYPWVQCLRKGPDAMRDSYN